MRCHGDIPRAWMRGLAVALLLARTAAAPAQETVELR
jgi:hypothetical protein